MTAQSPQQKRNKKNRTAAASSNKPVRWNNVLALAPDPREIRKRALVIAAGRAFGQKGFHNTTLDDIAEVLAVSKPALYRYIKNKHEILYECHRIAIGMSEDALDEAEAATDDPLEVLRLYVENYIRKMTSELGTCVVLTEYYSMTPEHNQLIQRRRRALDTRLRNLIQRCIDHGLVRPCNVKLAVFFFMGAINNINRWFSETGQNSGDEIARIFAEHVVQSLNPVKRERNGTKTKA
jgi:AcrR family transcriptional regulator